MGVKQSKRSLDITETSTKGEIEGFGNEGKVEKIVDGVMEKAAVNGHVDGDLQNGGESHQNGMELTPNEEIAAVVAEKVLEKKDMGESAVEEAVNGSVENGEINGEAEKAGEDVKKDDKKDRKKEKKEKVVKKKFSFRNFSFSKKDKSKVSKEEKSPGKMDEAGIEEVPKDAEKDMESSSPTQQEILESPKEIEKPELATTGTVVGSIMNQQTTEPEQMMEKVSEVTHNAKAATEDLPPPLPASPPPSEPVDAKISSDLQEPTNANTGVVETFSSCMNEVTSSISNMLSEKMEMPAEMIEDAEKIAIETGKQIEEKATNLLKTVEERAEESMRTAGEYVLQKKEIVMETVEKVAGGFIQQATQNGDTKLNSEEAATNVEDNLSSIPVEIPSLGSLASKAEESTEKAEESGAGESLADIPKDLAEEVTAAAAEATSNADSLEACVSLPPPPPPVEEPATGE